MNTIAFMGMPGGSELLLILFIILLLFGAKRLPELSRSLGKSLGEFKKGKEDLEREIGSVQEKVYEEVTKSEPEPVEEDAVETAETEKPEKAPDAEPVVAEEAADDVTDEEAKPPESAV